MLEIQEMKYLIPLILAMSVSSAYAQQSSTQKNTSFIRGGYAQEVMIQMDEDIADHCDINLSDIQTALVSRSVDAKLVDGRLVSGRVVERWNLRNCHTQDADYIVTLKGNPSGMNDLSVLRQQPHAAELSKMLD